MKVQIKVLGIPSDEELSRIRDGELASFCTRMDTDKTEAETLGMLFVAIERRLCS